MFCLLCFTFYVILPFETLFATRCKTFDCIKLHDSVFSMISYIPFASNVLLLYPLKISENCKIFWCFQRIEKGFIGNKWDMLTYGTITRWVSTSNSKAASYNFGRFFQGHEIFAKFLQLRDSGNDGLRSRGAKMPQR